MASGDIHITLVPGLSTVGPFTRVNEYGNTVTLTEKPLAGDPTLLAQFINEQQAASPAKTLVQVLDGNGRITLVLKES